VGEIPAKVPGSHDNSSNCSGVKLVNEIIERSRLYVQLISIIKKYFFLLINKMHWKNLVILFQFANIVESFYLQMNMPFWYPILPKRELHKKKIHNLMFMDEPYVCYKNNNKSYIIHSDICPHQGASLSKTGWVNENGNLQCGYHGFEFCDGNFCKIPDPSKNPNYFRSKINMKTFPTIENNDFLFFQPIIDSNLSEIFYPPEEYDSNFRAVDGYRIINNNYLSVCENLLDMLHISYVHSF
jgi:phenylpropionate dioxygenase-like ring-hydroxylating dioxygenase large terminal subunit